LHLEPCSLRELTAAKTIHLVFAAFFIYNFSTAFKLVSYLLNMLDSNLPHKETACPFLHHACFTACILNAEVFEKELW
jgi:hypothetical protein